VRNSGELAFTKLGPWTVEVLHLQKAYFITQAPWLV